MKNPGRFVGLVGAGLIAAANVQAADPGLFVVGSIGANLLQDMDFPAPAPVGIVTQSYDIGIRGDATVGYTFFANESIALAGAGEVGFMYNTIDKASGGGTTVRVDGDFYQAPFLGKFLVKFMPDSQFVPFVGVGGGGVYSRMRLDRVGGTVRDFEGDETDPAFQGEGGFGYKLGDKAAIGLVYKCLIGFPDGIDAFINHSLSIAFRASF
jgi:hypothetical protein